MDDEPIGEPNEVAMAPQAAAELAKEEAAKVASKGKLQVCMQKIYVYAYKKCVYIYIIYKGFSTGTLDIHLVCTGAR